MVDAKLGLIKDRGKSIAVREPDLLEIVLGG